MKISGVVEGVDQEVNLGDAPSLRESQKSSLDDLLARVEAATGADRELDGAICRAVGDQVASDQISGFIWRSGATGGWSDVPNLTASIDAVLALVERCLPGWEWSYHPDAGAKVWASFFLGGHHEACGDAETVPLAILSALLRALSDERDGSIGRG